MRLRRLPIYVNAYKEKPNAEIFIYYSSRGTGKTYDIATVNLERKFSADGGDTLAIRKKKNKTTQSIHKEILELLSRYNLRKFFNISKAKIESKSLIFGKKRAFVFEGGHDTRDLKSYAHFKDLWLEEANQFSSDDIEMLIPTMREQGGRIYMSIKQSGPQVTLAIQKILGKSRQSRCLYYQKYLSRQPIFERR